MGLAGIGIPGIILIAAVLLIFFGRGKIPQLMGDVAKGVTAFRKGLKEDIETSSDSEDEAKIIEAKAEETAEKVTQKSKTKA